MRMFMILATAFMTACSPNTVLQTPPPPPVAVPSDPRPTVTILIGLDGFRADYLDAETTPNLSRLAAQGAHGVMRPSFPTKTFPNFYTLVTGTRPDRHGIVGNRFEDPAHPGATFNQGSMAPHWWDQGEPIWVAAERAGVRSAMLFWPGDSRVIRGVRPSDWQLFDQGFTGEQRVETLLNWLDRPVAQRPRLLGVYFDTVDTAGHHHGPDSAQARDAVRHLDALIGTLTARLDAMGQRAHLIIVSDHGMGGTSPNRYIRLDHLADPNDYRVVESGPYAGIEPKPGREAALAAALLRPHAHMDCWRREAIPARLAFGTNPRAPRFLCLAKTGWMIGDGPARPDAAPGQHGWDPMAPEMAGIFIAHGPAIQSGMTLPAFDNIHVAPLARLLSGVPENREMDGQITVLERVLRR